MKVALVKPLHSGDPDVMHFSRSLLRFKRLAPSRAIRTSMRLIKYIPIRVKLSHDPQSRACDIAAWGGAVVVQAKVPNSSQKRRWNGSLHRVFACSAGGPGFDSRLQRINCVSQRTVASEQRMLSDAL